MYGKERMWGGVSWAASSLLEGALLDTSSYGILVVYLLQLLSSSVFIIAALIFETSNKSLESDTDVLETDATSQKLHGKHEYQAQTPACAGHSMLDIAWLTIESGGPQAALYFVLLFCLNMGSCLFKNLLFLYFVNDLHSSYTLCALTVIITIVVEVPLFAFAPTLLRTFGPACMLTVAAISYSLRAICYVVAPVPIAILSLEPLNGLTYSATQTAAVSFVADRAPPQYEASAQAIVASITAAGSATGAVVGGFVMEELGARTLYLGAASIVAFAAILFGLGSLQSAICPEECIPLKLGTGKYTFSSEVERASS